MLVFHGPREPVSSLAFVPGPDGPSLAAGYRRVLIYWPLGSGEAVEVPIVPTERAPGAGGVAELAANSDGSWVVGRWARGSRLWQRPGDRWIDIPGNRL